MIELRSSSGGPTAKENSEQLVRQKVNAHTLRVCYFGTYRANYSRNQIMIEGLRRNGVEVITCHEPLWHGIEDRVHAASGGFLKPRFVARVIRTYWRLLRVYRQVEDYDVMVLGYPGQFDVFLARVLTWLRRRRLVLDVFMSTYLIAMERGLVSRHPLTSRFIYWLEWLACRLPDKLILDTTEYVGWFHCMFGLAPGRFRLVPTGADDRVFRPAARERSSRGFCQVLYYGTFTPNHGVEHIVEAAGILRGEPDIRFELIGRGPTKVQAQAWAKEYGLSNITFADWVDRETLVCRAAEADIHLGAFGTTPQSMMTIQNKIYEGLAMARPVLTGDSATIRESFVHGEHVYLCERANPQAIADGILALNADLALRQRLAENGYRAFRSQFDLQHIGRRFAAQLSESAVVGLGQASAADPD